MMSFNNVIGEGDFYGEVCSEFCWFGDVFDFEIDYLVMLFF